MLKRLEYRGYDSAGIAYVSGSKIKVVRDKGKVNEVRAKVKPERLSSNIGVAHTRWATHGKPSQINAHPHADCSGRFVIAHNGIIENYLELKKELELKGHVFKSETDTEVIAHLIEDYFNECNDFFSAFQLIFRDNKLRGSYAIAAVSSESPNQILVARNDSPLLIGLGKKENFIASDVPAFLPYTKETLILEDGEFGVVTSDRVEVYKVGSGRKIRKVVKKQNTVEWDVSEAEKAGYHHFMLKEINEEPQAARNALKGRTQLKKIAKKVAGKERIYFVACGTAYHAGLAGKYLLEQFGIHAEAMVASEFRYSTVKTLDKDAAVITVSQSGETADTIAAVKGARKKGAYVASIVNVVGSTLTRVSDDVGYIYAGPEIAVASTKAYIGQLMSLTILGLLTAFERKKITGKQLEGYFKQLNEIPQQIAVLLEKNGIKDWAERCANAKTFFYIGRRQEYPTALEGALKLKEISYVHAEGYPAGELKHGPLALLEAGVVVIAIKSADDLREKMESNMQEVKSRRATLLSVSHDGDFKLPKTDPLFNPLLSIVPLHLFAYYISVLKGLDPDKPRNLAKSVTVE